MRRGRSDTRSARLLQRLVLLLIDLVLQQQRRHIDYVVLAELRLRLIADLLRAELRLRLIVPVLVNSSRVVVARAATTALVN